MRRFISITLSIAVLSLALAWAVSPPRAGAGGLDPDTPPKKVQQYQASGVPESEWPPKVQRMFSRWKKRMARRAAAQEEDRRIAQDAIDVSVGSWLSELAPPPLPSREVFAQDSAGKGKAAKPGAKKEAGPPFVKLSDDVAKALEWYIDAVEKKYQAAKADADKSPADAELKNRADDLKKKADRARAALKGYKETSVLADQKVQRDVERAQADHEAQQKTAAATGGAR